MLRVGFGRADITPDLGLGLPMAGNAPWPSPAGVTWPLRGRVLLADDGRARVAMVCLDLLALPATEVATLRRRLAAAGGLAPEAILVACTHTHRAPFTHLAGVAFEEAVFGYLDAIGPLLADAVAAAAADLQPARRELLEPPRFVGRPEVADPAVGGELRPDGIVGTKLVGEPDRRELPGHRDDGRRDATLSQ